MRTVELVDNVVVNIYTLKRSAVLEFYGGRGRPVFIEVEDDENVEVGYTYDKNLGFSGPSVVKPATTPPPPGPAWLTSESVVWWTESKYQELLAEFPQGEKTSWDTQVREAESLLVSSQASTPFIDSQAAITGESRAELAQKILQKAGELSAFSGLLTGIRRQTTARIHAGEELLAEDLDKILATALGGQ